jgi:hypothetical protein
MADTTTAAKTEVKTEAKTEVKTEAKADAKEVKATDAGSGKEKETASSTSDAPAGYSRGENQKLVTDAYRNNWDNIFGTKPTR